MSAYTDADVQAATEALHTNWGTDPKAPPADCNWATRIVLDAVAPAIAARAKAEALRELAEAMDGGFIEWDDLRHKTTDAPKGWVESCIEQAWESQLVWAPYLRLRADEIERT